MKFSDDTILKALGSIKMFGYLNGFIKGYVKRSNLIDKLIDELGYVKDNARELTPAGDNLLRENFVRFHELMENDSHFG